MRRLFWNLGLFVNVYFGHSNLKTLVRKAGVESPTQLLKDPQATVTFFPLHIHLPPLYLLVCIHSPQREALSKPLPVAPKPKEKKPKVTKSLPKVDKSEPQSAPKPVPKAKAAPKAKAKPAPPPKPLPKPVWTRVPVAMNREDVETRIHIREFILRFASVLQIANSNVDELEELAGPSLGALNEWEDQEDVELVGWVSEGCLKAIILGLLEIGRAHV